MNRTETMASIFAANELISEVGYCAWIMPFLKSELNYEYRTQLST